MKFIGLVLTIVAILLGFYFGGGDLKMLWQPVEIFVISGAGFGSFIFSNSSYIVKAFFTHFKLYFSSAHFNEKMYVEMLNLVQDMSRIQRQDGLLAIIRDIESPKPAIFQKYRTILKDYDNQQFLVDAFLTFAEAKKGDFMLSELKMKNRIKNYSMVTRKLSDALYRLGESMPAFGIIAAVLGIILAMGEIDQSATVIGQAISAALVGTLLGVLFGYGLFIPMSMTVRNYAHDQEIFQKYILQAVMMVYKEARPMAIQDSLLRDIPHHIKNKISIGY